MPGDKGNPNVPNPPGNIATDPPGLFKIGCGVWWVALSFDLSSTTCGSAYARNWLRGAWKPTTIQDSPCFRDSFTWALPSHQNQVRGSSCSSPHEVGGLPLNWTLIQIAGSHVLVMDLSRTVHGVMDLFKYSRYWRNLGQLGVKAWSVWPTVLGVERSLTLGSNRKCCLFTCVQHVVVCKWILFGIFRQSK